MWEGFEGCWGKGAHFRACLGVGSFIPAFARCCFCIARHSLRSACSLPYGSRTPARGGYASLLVFTSPLTSPLALLNHYYCVNRVCPCCSRFPDYPKKFRHLRIAELFESYHIQKGSSLTGCPVSFISNLQSRNLQSRHPLSYPIL